MCVCVVIRPWSRLQRRHRWRYSNWIGGCSICKVDPAISPSLCLCISLSCCQWYNRSFADMRISLTSWHDLSITVCISSRCRISSRGRMRDRSMASATAADGGGGGGGGLIRRLSTKGLDDDNISGGSNGD